MQITKRHWGTIDHRDIYLFELSDAGICARISNYGGIIQSLIVPDRNGAPTDVVLGYDTPAEYARGGHFFGASIGPIADRMAGGKCVLNGREIQMARNSGPDCMHCSSDGFHTLIWDAEIMDDGVSLRRYIPKFDLNMEIRFRLLKAGLRLEYAAQSDRESAVCPTNHSYFNLSGAKTDVCGDRITVYANRYAETERAADPIVTGRAIDVTGTPMDMRRDTAIGDVLAHSEFREIQTGGGVDHYFLVDGTGMRPMADVYCPATGIAMRCASDAPGILVYTGNGLERESGKGGAIYRKNWAVCLETERFPNAVNIPALRNTALLKPDEQFTSATEYTFSIR